MPNKNVDIMPRFAPGIGNNFIGGKRVVGMGWKPDLPDIRDYSIEKVCDDIKVEIKKRTKRRKDFDILRTDETPPTEWLENEQYCSPIEDQETLGSCTANAVIGMIEYLMKKTKNEYENLSRLFLYKATRNLMNAEGDTGAYIRTTIKAARLFGIPPELNHPYIIEYFDEEPSAFLYSFAANYKSLSYARIDKTGNSGKDTLKELKRIISSGYVVAFGFSVYNTISNSPDIPYPTEKDTLQGGHAVLAVGYDDNHECKQTGEIIPSLKIRNSWGSGWGESGYGYLPYSYVENELAMDFWTIFNQDWVNLSDFD